MKIQSTTISRLPARFKFKGSGLLLIAGLLILGMFAFPIFLIEQTGRSPVDLGEEIYSALFAFFVVVMIMVSIASVDIIVDELCISRSFLGWTFQSIRWDNIKLITTRPYCRMDQKKMTRIISVYPSIKPRPRLTPSGLMTFFGSSRKHE